MVPGLDAAGDGALGITILTHRGHQPLQGWDATTPISSSLSLTRLQSYIQHNPDLNFHSRAIFH